MAAAMEPAVGSRVSERVGEAGGSRGAVVGILDGRLAARTAAREDSCEMLMNGVSIFMDYVGISTAYGKTRDENISLQHSNNNF